MTLKSMITSKSYNQGLQRTASPARSASKPAAEPGRYEAERDSAMFKKRRSIKLAKGVRVNMGKKGVSSVSVGGKGLTLNSSKRGLKGTASIRGTGVSKSGYLSKPSSKTQSEESAYGGGALLFLVVLVFLVWIFSNAS